MCIQRLRKRYNTWVNQHEIHPIWLSLKDSKMQAKYTKELRTHILKIMKIVTAFAVVFVIISLIQNSDKTSEEQIQGLLRFTPLIPVLTFTFLAIKWKPVLADYLVFILAASIAAN